MEKHWVKIFITANPVQAELSKQMLEEHGVVSVIINKQDSSYRFGQLELYVHESEAVFARGLITEMETGDEEA
ncbi:putative signal transducing protein [Parapedobacter pyrenivorans]|uniref:putative signal transducing protein n=1 Tax=Parapedobacter pyrenivorans TaxID=1305674 RepID=UPI00333F55ED